MVLLLYKDAALRDALPKVHAAGKQVYRFQLPRNSPGGVSKGRFWIFNDSPHFVENLHVVHNNGQVHFYFKDSIPPRDKTEVTVEWNAPIAFKEALVLFFKIEADEVVKPRIS